MKQSLRVRTEGLRKAEELNVSVFLRFVGQSERGHWSLSQSPEAEIVLCAAEAPAPALAPAAHLIWVADADAAPPPGGKGILRRPLQVEAFGALLRNYENALSGAHAAQTDAGSAAVPTQKPAVVDAQEHRLRRWPGEDLLQNRREHKILATFLVSRSMSVTQLAALSGIGRDACADFVSALQGRGLLETRGLSAAHASAPAYGHESAAQRAHRAAASPANQPQAAAAGGGLINRLRKRLGLG